MDSTLLAIFKTLTTSRPSVDVAPGAAKNQLPPNATPTDAILNAVSIFFPSGLTFPNATMNGTRTTQAGSFTGSIQNMTLVTAWSSPSTSAPLTSGIAFNTSSSLHTAGSLAPSEGNATPITLSALSRKPARSKHLRLPQMPARATSKHRHTYAHGLKSEETSTKQRGSKTSYDSTTTSTITIQVSMTVTVPATGSRSTSQS